jgi:hypothetical protein
MSFSSSTIPSGDSEGARRHGRVRSDNPKWHDRGWDGGIPAYRGDVAIKNGKIAMISGRVKATAKKEVDGDVIGAIGVSFATAEEAEQVAKAELAALTE